MQPDADPESKKIDLDAAARLVAMLERDLERAKKGEASLDDLRSEVEQLRAGLSSGTPHADVHRGLTGLRERLHALGDELFDDAVKGSEYIARIGRLLGM